MCMEHVELIDTCLQEYKRKKLLLQTNADNSDSYHFFFRDEAFVGCFCVRACARFFPPAFM